MKNRNKNNAGFTLMELLIGIALVAIIAFFGMKLMAQVNPEGWETVNVSQVLEGKAGSYALTEEGIVLPIANRDIAEKIQAGENRLQISKSAEGLNVITGFKAADGEVISVAAAQDQKKSLTQLPPMVAIPAETLVGLLMLLGTVCLAVGLVLGLVLAIRAVARKASSLLKSDKKPEAVASEPASPAVSVPAAEITTAKAKVTPPAPPASEPKTALEAAFQKAETAA